MIQLATRLSSQLLDVYGLNQATLFIPKNDNNSRVSHITKEVIKQIEAKPYEAVFACSAYNREAQTDISAKRYHEVVDMLEEELSEYGAVLRGSPNGNPVYKGRHIIDSLVFVPNIPGQERKVNINCNTSQWEGTHCCGVNTITLTKRTAKENMKALINSYYSPATIIEVRAGKAHFVIRSPNTARMSSFAKFIHAHDWGVLEFKKSSRSDTCFGLLTPDNKKIYKDQVAIARKEARARASTGAKKVLMAVDWAL